MADVPSGAQDGGGGHRPRRAAAAWPIACSELSRRASNAAWSSCPHRARSHASASSVAVSW